MQITSDLQRAVREVPPWGWGLIGIGTLYMVLRHRGASAGSGATSSASLAVPTPPGISDPSAGMSAYIEGLNSGQQQQTEIWAQELQNLQESNAALMQAVANSQASQAAGQGSTPVPSVPIVNPGNLGGPDGGFPVDTVNPIMAQPGGYVGVVDPGTLTNGSGGSSGGSVPTYVPPIPPQPSLPTNPIDAPPVRIYDPVSVSMPPLDTFGPNLTGGFPAPGTGGIDPALLNGLGGVGAVINSPGLGDAERR